MASGDAMPASSLIRALRDSRGLPPLGNQVDSLPDDARGHRAGATASVRVGVLAGQEQGPALAAHPVAVVPAVDEMPTPPLPLHDILLDLKLSAGSSGGSGNTTRPWPSSRSSWRGERLYGV